MLSSRAIMNSSKLWRSSRLLARCNATAPISSVDRVIGVKKSIQEKTEAAKLGGGKKRIETQHKRVS